MEYYSKKPPKQQILYYADLSRPTKVENITAKDLEKAIFSFNFGISLLDSFIKLHFGNTFGVNVLDIFIKK